MKHKILFLFLFIPSIFLAQSNLDSNLKTISGFVSFKNKKLPNVNIFVENSTKFAVTDSIGFYAVKAKVGDFLNFNFVGLEDVEILIEDVTSTLNIEMREQKGISFSRSYDDLKLGGTTIGDYFEGPLKVVINGKELNPDETSLTRAIAEKVPSLLVKINDFGEEIIYQRGKELNGPPVWVFDEVLYDLPIPVFINEVENILVINTEAKLIIQVNTTINYRTVSGIDFDSYYFIEDDFYQNDAIAYKRLKVGEPEFLNKYKGRFDDKEALSIYQETYKEEHNFANYHLSIFEHFKNEKYNKNTLLKVLADFEEFSNNPEDLKAIAYKYQELNENEKALEVYKKILKLRPDYSQSYRDVANVLLDLKEYPQAWKAYQYYLHNDFNIEDDDIGEILISEIIATENNSGNENSTQGIKVDSPTKNTESDIRVVFEWNTSEAEFILEFVNPNKFPFSIENSTHVNNDLIIDQKEKGYTSKEIFIDDLQNGNWLVNLTYLGNKHYKPTVFKVTTYYNWGRENQRKDIHVFDLMITDKKIELLKLNKRSF
ncbi:hypothetical protein [Polaribacter sp. Hel_I_88]|uniref:hypothetical protein n=1 Tax=Polaribacter sp. Hel_I_88 TaxID=1250006 RepID=UPI000479397C|nr:hypothetical protein [Polaribacter sp. Hel_I_88]